jgi:hypothetical protein
MDDRVARLGPDEVPGPGNMCFHWKGPRELCVLKPEHEGDHVYSIFTITEETNDGSSGKSDQPDTL